MNRRRYLQLLAGSGAFTGLAGCSGLDTDGEESPATETGNTTTPTETPVASTPTPTETATPEPDNPPTLATATATPQDNGETLAYQVVAEDDNGLQYVAVTYGDQTREWEDLGRTINEEGELTDLGQPPEEGQVAFIARDTAGQETQEQRYPDQQAPTLAQFAAEPTENAGEIDLTLQGEDNVGLEQLALLLDGNPQLQENISGQAESSVDTTVDVSDNATVGEKNTLTATLEDWNGNTTQTDSDTYVRKYDVMEDTRLDIGAEYFPMGEAMFGQCLEDGVETSPAVGSDNYGRPIEPWVTSRHIDQMQGHGITRVNYTYEGNEHGLESFLSSSLIDEIEIGAHYFISPAHFWNDSAESWKEDIVKPHMTSIRENILSRENTAREDGRPMLTISNAGGGWVNEERRERIMDEWGSYENFVEDIRSHLEVDGTNPYIVGGFGAMGFGYGDEHEALASQFDAVTSGKARPIWEDEVSNWETAIEFFEENYSGHRDFAREHNLDFLPVVIPGFDDRANTCWGGNRYFPRSQDGFRDLLELAEEYGTTDKIDIATWNDWTEGHQIEPGTWRGEDYGTTYVETVREFQS